MKNPKSLLNKSIEKISGNIISKQSLSNEILKTLIDIFPNSTVNFYLLKKGSFKIDINLTNKTAWPIPDSDIKWLKSSNNFTLDQQSNNTSTNNGIYIKKRSTIRDLDIQQIIADKNKFSYDCTDALYVKLQNDNNELFGVAFVHNWNNRKNLQDTYPNLDNKILAISSFFNNITNAVENIFIHDKIKSLLHDKNQLKQKIQEDEEDLKRRLLELSTINDGSYKLNKTLSYKKAIKITMDSISKVIRYDACSIIVTKFSKNNDLFIRIRNPLNDSLFEQVINQSINFLRPFNSETIEKRLINHHIEKKHFENNGTQNIEKFNSFTNIPLKFNDEVIGLMSFYSEKNNAFHTNEISFLNTFSNQLSAKLGKLNLIKKLEKSKISSLILNMADPVIFYDSYNHTEIYNESAKKEFNLPDYNSPDNIKSILDNLSMQNLYSKVEKSKIPIKNQHININNKTFTVNISPISHEDIHLGIILVFRDITELQKVDRIKTQRLEAIEKVNKIIEHIQNLNQLLSFLMNYLLDIAKSEMGSIQLIQEGVAQTKVHSNFPDKINKHYQFKNNKTISQSAIESKKTIFIENYFESNETNPNVKILIDSYICIPIVINKEIIGIVNIARKFGSTAEKLSEDDIKTLTTLTNLSGTAILNALYFESKQKNEKFEQELAIAKRIQKNILPQEIPQFDKFTFAAKSKSAHFIGGDYYDFIQLNRDSIGIVIADIIGKGIPAGLHMATLKSILTNNLKKNSSPKQVLSKINNILFNDPVIDKFTPLFYGIINKKKMTFTFSNAGHEPGIVLRDGKLIQLDTKGFPVGAYKNTEFEEKTIKIKNEDLFIFTTDGIIETKNKQSQVYGYRRLYNFIKKNKDTHPQSFINNLEEHLKSFSSNDQQSDDQTIIVAKVNYNVSNKTRSKILKTKEIKVNSDIKKIREIRYFIADLLKNQNLNQSFIHDIQLAVNEAHANIIEHAYNGETNGEIIFKIIIYNDKIEIIIRDLGQKFNAFSTKEGINYLKELDGSGLGMHLIKTLMDKIEYSSKTIGTQLKLTKFKNLS